MARVGHCSITSTGRCRIRRREHSADTYAVAAYILSLSSILPEDGNLDRESLPKVKIPNRDGVLEPNFDPAKLFRQK